MLNCIPGERDFHSLLAGDGISSKTSWAGERKGNKTPYSLHWVEMGAGILTAVFQTWGGGSFLSALVRNGGSWLLVSVGFLGTGLSRFLELIHMASSFKEEKEEWSGLQVKGLLRWKKKIDNWGAWGAHSSPVCVHACIHTWSLLSPTSKLLTALLIAVGLSGATHRLPGYAEDLISAED